MADSDFLIQAIDAGWLDAAKPGSGSGGHGLPGPGGLGLRGPGCPGDGSGLELDEPNLFPASADEVREAVAACASIRKARPPQRLALAARACGSIASCGARCPSEIAAWAAGDTAALAECDDVRCSPYAGREAIWLHKHLRAYFTRIGLKDNCGLAKSPVGVRSP